MVTVVPEGVKVEWWLMASSFPDLKDAEVSCDCCIKILWMPPDRFAV